MTPSQSILTALCTLLNLCLIGSAFSLPEVELPPEDVPSFYWARQRLGRVSVELPDGEIAEENAIDHWNALADERQMRVWVSDVWSQLPYDSRYRLVRGLGDIAARKGYSLVVYDRSNTVLATYDCHDEGDGEGGESQEQDRNCDIELNPTTTVAEPPPRL